MAENGADGVVDEVDSSVEIASVTFACRCARKRACRRRPEARPSGERLYARLAARCCTRRRAPAHGAHIALSEAHPAQKTLTSEHPTHRPNRPSTREPPSQGRLDTRGVRRHRDPRRARCPMRSPRGVGWQDPSLHLLQPAHSTSSPRALRRACYACSNVAGPAPRHIRGPSRGAGSPPRSDRGWHASCASATGQRSRPRLIDDGNRYRRTV